MKRDNEVSLLTAELVLNSAQKISKGISFAGRHSSKKGNEFNYVENLEKFGLDNVNPSEENLTGVNGSFLSFTLLRHLKIRDLKRQVGHFFSFSLIKIFPASYDRVCRVCIWRLLVFWITFVRLNEQLPFTTVAYRQKQIHCKDRRMPIWLIFWLYCMWSWTFKISFLKSSKSYQRNGKRQKLGIPFLHAQYTKRFSVIEKFFFWIFRLELN